MNKLLYSIILLTAIVPFFTLCTKDQRSFQIINTEWEVRSITAPDPQFILIAPTPYPVKFMEDSIFTIRLDVNSCGSTYRLEAENNINFNSVGCTKICCDSAFANSLINILKDVYSFNIVGNDLKLFAPDRIINLKKVNNNN